MLWKSKSLLVTNNICLFHDIFLWVTQSKTELTLFCRTTVRFSMFGSRLLLLEGTIGPWLFVKNTQIILTNGTQENCNKEGNALTEKSWQSNNVGHQQLPGTWVIVGAWRVTVWVCSAPHLAFCIFQRRLVKEK